MTKKFKGVFKTKSKTFTVIYKARSKGTYSCEILAAKIYNIHVLKENKITSKINFKMTKEDIKNTWSLFNQYQEKRSRSKQRSLDRIKHPEPETRTIDGITYKSSLGIWSFTVKFHKGKINNIGGFKTLTKAKEACEKFQFKNFHMIAGC